MVLCQCTEVTGDGVPALPAVHIAEGAGEPWRVLPEVAPAERRSREAGKASCPKSCCCLSGAQRGLAGGVCSRVLVFSELKS